MSLFILNDMLEMLDALRQERDSLQRQVKIAVEALEQYSGSTAEKALSEIEKEST